jgi:hypothetical protein
MIPTVRQGPAALNLEFYQGDTEPIVVYLPADLTGAVVRLQVRTSAGAVLVTLVEGSGLQVIPGELPPATPDNPTPTPPSSRINIAPTLPQRDALVGRELRYDLEVTMGAQRSTWLRGGFMVVEELTA